MLDGLSISYRHTNGNYRTIVRMCESQRMQVSVGVCGNADVESITKQSLVMSYYYEVTTITDAIKQGVLEHVTFHWYDPTHDEYIEVQSDSTGYFDVLGCAVVSTEFAKKYIHPLMEKA